MKKYQLIIFAALIAAAGLVIFWMFRDEMPQTIENYFTVTLTVSTETLLENMHLLHSDKHELVPVDGIIFPKTVVTVYEGDNVFDVLQREMRNARIHLVSRQMPIFDAVYVEAINNIFEFDSGPLSGWKYRVNGVFPSHSASSFVLQDGDFIEWLYTIDLGRDLDFEQQR